MITMHDASDYVADHCLQAPQGERHATCSFVRQGSCRQSARCAPLTDAPALKFSNMNERYVDDLTGLPLVPELCVGARKKEIDYFKSKGVWEYRPISEAVRKMGRGPISVRWVETNKGDDDHPNVRSRLVAREIRTAGQEAIFAPTPPLESLRMVLSYAATTLSPPGGHGHVRDPRSERRTQILSLIHI